MLEEWKTNEGNKARCTKKSIEEKRKGNIDKVAA